MAHAQCVCQETILKEDMMEQDTSTKGYIIKVGDNYVMDKPSMPRLTNELVRARVYKSLSFAASVARRYIGDAASVWEVSIEASAIEPQDND